MEKSRELDTPLSAKELEDKEQRGQSVPARLSPDVLLLTASSAGRLSVRGQAKAAEGGQDPIKCLLYQEAFPNDFCLGRKDSPSPERPTYVLWFSPSLGHLADGRSPAGPYLLLLDPRALSLGSGETGGRYLSLQHGLTPAVTKRRPSRATLRRSSDGPRNASRPARLIHIEEQVSKHSDGREEARKSQMDFSGKTRSPSASADGHRGRKKYGSTSRLLEKRERFIPNQGG
ncbi:unnamed protein product [Rangifer tarandus platyrhynchus]|uniref:Uncharacterized protein n=1 Tax=Rangifer tarandus platyrhynchus TaxID=3082113 RepID=A0AC59YK58_RANTA